MGTQARIAGIAACAAALMLAAPASGAGLPGDFDGDGRSDLAVGAPVEDLPSLPGGDQGFLSEVPGTIAGLDPASAVGWSQETAGLRGDGAEVGERFAANLTAGDFNGDGNADLVVGVPSESVRGAEGDGSSAGAVHVIYGSTGGLTTLGDDYITADDAGIAGDGAEQGDLFGQTVAAGDWDGDGRDDIAVAATQESLGAEFVGAITVLYGTPNGVATARSKVFHLSSKGMAGDGAEGQEQWGQQIVAGDWDGDGRDDLAASSTREVLGPDGQQEGAVNVLYGSRKGLTTKGDKSFTQATAGIPSDPEDFDQFGIELAGGDFDGDRADDLAIATREDGSSSFDGTGSVHVLYGGDGGLSASGDELLSKELDGFPSQGGQPADQFGNTLAAGRFDAGRQDELAIGIPGEDVGPPIRAARGVVADAGAVAVMYGSGAGLLSSGPGGTVTFDAELYTQNTPGIEGDGAEPSDQVGVGDFAVGDFDGAGREDLAIGVEREGVGAQSAAGAVHVLYGTLEGLTLDFDQYFTQSDADATSESIDFFGSSLAP